MRRNLSVLIAKSAIVLTACGLLATSAGCSPDMERQELSPSPVAVALSEDDPGFNCLIDGNRICGPVMMDDTRKAAAWEAWDAQQGWTQTRVDPTRSFEVELGNYSTAPFYDGPQSVILAHTDGYYYSYVITYP